MLLAVGPVSQPRAGESVATRRVRYRTVGDMSCTGAVESDAASVADVVTEVAASTLTERGATRADDRISEAAMEDRKKELLMHPMKFCAPSSLRYFKGTPQ